MPQRVRHARGLTARFVARNRIRHGIEQLLVAKWFLEKVHCPGFHRAYRHGDRPASRHEDEWNRRVRCKQLVMECKATPILQARLDHDAGWTVLVVLLQAFG